MTEKTIILKPGESMHDYKAKSDVVEEPEETSK